MDQLSNLDFKNAAKIVNLPDPSGAQDAATKAYVDANIEGMAWKDSVRAASTANINLASPGAAIDGVTMAANDRFLAKNQSTGAENGIYIWNGAAVAATRSPDASTAAELEAAVVNVEEGTTNAGTQWRQTAVNFTLGSGAVAWTTFGTSAPAASETTSGIAELATQAETDAGTDDLRIVTPLKLKTSPFAARSVTGTLGDGSAVSIAITHNFATRDVDVVLYRNSSPWDTVYCDQERTDANTVTFKFAVAPTSAQYAYRISKKGG